MKLRQALVAMLAAEGVDVLFGLMGDGNMLLILDAVESHGIRFVNARHETAAVLMADGYARVSGRTAAVTMTHGPGLAAAGLGIGVAEVARSPLLVIASDTGRGEALHVQRFDQETFAKSLAQDVVSLRTSRGALPTLSRAFGRLHARQGPVVLSVAVDVQDEDVGDELPPASASPAAGRLLADDAAVGALARRIASARFPVLLAGRGSRHAAAQIAALADQTNALLGTTIPARGLFEGHARNVGVVGGLSTAATRQVMARADLIVGFGASLSRWTADHGHLAPQARWAQVTDDAANRVAPQVPVELRVHGDALDVATRLADQLGRSESQWKLDDLAAARRQATEDEARAFNPDNERGLDPRRVSRRANAVLPTDRTEVVGVGHFGGFPAIESKVDADGLFLAPWEFGSIGVALPIALGASLARPDRMTLAWEGDGSLLASLGELETLARGQARVVVIVMDDGAYTAEVRKLVLAGRSPELARFGRSDLAACARALGMAAHTAVDSASLEAALQAALLATGPLLIHVHVDPDVHQAVF